MKKLIYPQLALLLLATAACSSEDTPVAPAGDVILVAAVPQNVEINAPAQASVPQQSAFTGTMTYEGGQEISYATYTVSGTPIAFVTSIGGSNSTVVVPSTLTLKSGEKDVNFTVVGWNLSNYQGISENVETLRIAGTARRWFSEESSNAMRAMTDADWTGVINQTSNLKNIELGSGFTGYVSINGAVYSEDMETFVACPRGRQGEFVVANGVKTIGSKSFNECAKLTRIVLPASVEKIADNAMIFDGDLLAIDILAPTAPQAGEYAFGVAARAAQLRVPNETARQTYLVEEFTKNAPEIPESLLELTAPTAAGRNNTAATAALYVTACNTYSGVAQTYAQVLAAYKDMMTYFNSDNMVNETYVTKIDAYVAAKNSYFEVLRKYEQDLLDYTNAVAEIQEGDELAEASVTTNAFNTAKEQADAMNETVGECSKLYTEASKIYAERKATYEEELNNSEAYAGYKFFNPANITVMNFNVK